MWLEGSPSATVSWRHRGVAGTPAEAGAAMANARTTRATARTTARWAPHRPFASLDWLACGDRADGPIFRASCACPMLAPRRCQGPRLGDAEAYRKPPPGGADRRAAGPPGGGATRHVPRWREAGVAFTRPG